MYNEIETIKFKQYKYHMNTLFNYLLKCKVNPNKSEITVMRIHYSYGLQALHFQDNFYVFKLFSK